MSLQVQLERDGFEIIPSFLRAPECDALTESLEKRGNEHAPRSSNRRNVLFEVPEILHFARSRPVLTLLASRVQDAVFPVRAILFDKTPEANWPVAWHQDQIIAVVERIDVEGFTAWSVKQGVPHVRPPARVLNRMITLRLHLDDCRAEQGALQVLPGSHRAGLLDDEEVEGWEARMTLRICEVPRGGVLLMKPLLLHASRAARNARHRRVLHIEYAMDPLPGGLRWCESGTSDSV